MDQKYVLPSNFRDGGYEAENFIVTSIMKQVCEDVIAKYRHTMLNPNITFVLDQTWDPDSATGEVVSGLAMPCGVVIFLRLLKRAANVVIDNILIGESDYCYSLDSSDRFHLINMIYVAITVHCIAHEIRHQCQNRDPYQHCDASYRQLLENDADYFAIQTTMEFIPDMPEFVIRYIMDNGYGMKALYQVIVQKPDLRNYYIDCLAYLCCDKGAIDKLFDNYDSFLIYNNINGQNTYIPIMLRKIIVTPSKYFTDLISFVYTNRLYNSISLADSEIDSCIKLDIYEAEDCEYDETDVKTIIIKLSGTYLPKPFIDASMQSVYGYYGINRDYYTYG